MVVTAEWVFSGAGDRAGGGGETDGGMCGFGFIWNVLITKLKLM